MRSLVVVILAIMLMGCASQPARTNSPTVAQQPLKRMATVLELGMTPAEVRELFGKPYSISNSGGYERYTYGTTNGFSGQSLSFKEGRLVWY